MTFPERAHAWLDAGVAVPEATDEITARLGAQDKRIGALYLAQASGGQVLTEILAELKRITAALGSASDSRSSVELKVASARTAPDPTVKCYAGSPLAGLVDTALAEFGRLKREAEAHSLDGWRETIDGLSK